MSFVVRNHRLVDADQLAAADWYDEQQPGLGDGFLDESEAAITSLTKNALLHAVRFDDVRCMRLRRFRKYGVFYVVRGIEVHLLAIHHGSRDTRWVRERRQSMG